MSTQWHVGQPVMVVDLNRPARRGVVTRVGRKLVGVKVDDSGRRPSFRIADGVRNDAGHQHILTLVEYAAASVRASSLGLLRDRGIRLEQRAQHDDALIARLVAALDEP